MFNHTGEDVPIDDDFPEKYLFAISIKTPWFANMANYRATGKFPPHFSPNHKKRIIRKSVDYSWIRGYLFVTEADLIICKCVREDEIYDILIACHDEPCRGHFADKRTTYKILHSSYYWLNLFK